jgi:hypothetical protein
MTVAASASAGGGWVSVLSVIMLSIIDGLWRDCRLGRDGTRPCLRSFLLGRPRFTLLLDLPQDALDAVVLLDAFVEEEAQLGRPTQPETPGQLPAQEGVCPLERPRGLAPRFVVPERRVIDPRLLEIGRDVDPRHRQEADAWIVHLAAQHPRDLHANLVADALRT